MRTILHGIPWLLPGLALTVWLAWLLYRRPTGVLGVPRPIAIALLIAVGLVVSATLTPGSDAPYESAVACVVERPRLLGPRELIRPSESALNVYLFVPLGLVAVLLPGWRRVVAAVAVGVAAPFAIELAQRALPVLGRGCQSPDVVDNLTGLAIGCALGLVVRLVLYVVPRALAPPNAHTTELQVECAG